MLPSSKNYLCSSAYGYGSLVSAIVPISFFSNSRANTFDCQIFVKQILWKWNKSSNCPVLFNPKDIRGDNYME